MEDYSMIPGWESPEPPRNNGGFIVFLIVMILVATWLIIYTNR